MTDLTLEEIEKVAKGVGYLTCITNKVLVSHKPKDESDFEMFFAKFREPFSPDSDADAMKVFRALVDECKRCDKVIHVTEGRLEMGEWEWDYINAEFDQDFSNDAIFRAYLSLMD